MTDSDTNSEVEADDIKLQNGQAVYGNDKVDVGIDGEGNGYIEIAHSRSENFMFEVSEEQVREFVAQSSRNAPASRPKPEGHIEEPDVPEGWKGGELVHTGGGIWKRIFYQERLEGGQIRVVYDPQPPIKGVQAGAYDEEGVWLGAIEQKPLSGDPMEQQALEKAYELIDAIDDGEHYHRIEDLFDG